MDHPLVGDAINLESQIEQEALALNHLRLAMSQEVLDLITAAIAECRRVGLTEESTVEMRLAGDMVTRMIQRTNKELNTLRSEFAELQSKALLQEQELELVRRQHDENTRDRTELKRRLSTITTQLSDTALQTRQIELDKTSIQTERDKAVAQIQTLTTKLSEAEDKVQHLLQDVSDKRGRIGEVEAELSVTKLHLQSAQDREAETGRRQRDTQSELDRTALLLSQSTSDVAALKAEIERYKERLTEADSQARANSDTIRSLNLEVSAAKAATEKQAQLVQDHAVTIQQLQSELVAARQEGLVMQTSHQRATSEVERSATVLQMQLSTTQAELEGVKQRLTYATERSQEITAQKEQAEKAKATAEQTVYEQTREIQQLQQQLMQAKESDLNTKSDLSRRTLELDTEKTRLTQAQARIQELTQERDTTRASLTQTEATLNSEKQRADGLAKDLSATQGTLARTEQTRDETQASLKAAEAQIAALNEQLGTKRTEAEGLSTRIANLQDQLEELNRAKQAAADAATKAQFQMEQTINETRAKLADTEKDLTTARAELEQKRVEIALTQERMIAQLRENEDLHQSLAEKTQNEKRMEQTNIKYQGFLKKTGGTANLSVNSRFFVLKSDFLFYYNNGSENLDNPTGVIPLVGVQVKAVGKKSNGWGFEIAPTDASKMLQSSKRKTSGAMVKGTHASMLLYAETEKSCDEWVAAIGKVIASNAAPAGSLLVPS
eukprot:c52378_g1_i1.p1 GENE.c52378_g1_i1~~c52378_g1_i1.p1  ORF type:complete len:776 (+),score=243.50 c52378_g1_i1:148-2328(+)